MTEKSYKCPFCHKSVLASEAIPHQKRYWHPDCLQQKNEQQKAKKAIQEEVRNSRNSDPDYKELVKYICKLYGLDELTVMIRSQIDKYHEHFGMKYKGMQLSLEYFYEIKGNEIELKYGIGIIPNIYDKAKEFYLAQKRFNKSLKSTHEQTQQSIKVDVNQRRKNTKLIDISKI